MPLFDRIYFNGVFGALGGLLGWMLFAVFGDKSASQNQVGIQLLLGGACIGGAVREFVVSRGAVRDRSLGRFCLPASDCGGLGAGGGALRTAGGGDVNL